MKTNYTTSILKVVCENLRGRRLQKDIRQSDLAETLEMRQPVLSKIERCKAPTGREFRLSLTKLCDFAQALGVPIETLFIPHAYPPPPNRDTASVGINRKRRRRNG